MNGKRGNKLDCSKLPRQARILMNLTTTRLRAPHNSRKRLTLMILIIDMATSLALRPIERWALQRPSSRKSSLSSKKKRFLTQKLVVQPWLTRIMSILKRTRLMPCLQQGKNSYKIRALFFAKATLISCIRIQASRLSWIHSDLRAASFTWLICAWKLPISTIQSGFQKRSATSGWGFSKCDLCSWFSSMSGLSSSAFSDRTMNTPRSERSQITVKCILHQWKKSKHQMV